MTQQITPEMVAAWRTLQEFARSCADSSTISITQSAIEAIDVLDNSDFMVPIEEAGDEERPIPQITTQSAMTGGIHRSQIQPLDPGEWADTTREDMARRQREERGPGEGVVYGKLPNNKPGPSVADVMFGKL